MRGEKPSRYLVLRTLLIGTGRVARSRGTWKGGYEGTRREQQRESRAKACPTAQSWKWLTASLPKSSHRARRERWEKDEGYKEKKYAKEKEKDRSTKTTVKIASLKLNKSHPPIKTQEKKKLSEKKKREKGNIKGVGEGEEAGVKV